MVEGARVAERWTGWSIHQGEFQGIVPTGRQGTVPGFVFYHVASGRIKRSSNMLSPESFPTDTQEAKRPIEERSV